MNTLRPETLTNTKDLMVGQKRNEGNALKQAMMANRQEIKSRILL